MRPRPQPKAQWPPARVAFGFADSFSSIVNSMRSRKQLLGRYCDTGCRREPLFIVIPTGVSTVFLHFLVTLASNEVE